MKNAFFNEKDYNIPADKFKLANENVKLSDQKFVDKPIGYFHDAWIRFRKNKSSVVAMIIIILIMIFSLVAPLFVTTHDSSFCDVYYSKKGPRVEALYNLGFDGGQTRTFTEKSLILAISTGMAAEDVDGTGNVTIGQGLDSEYQPIIKIKDTFTTLVNKQQENRYKAEIDTYLERGFLYKSIMQDELAKIQEFEKETGLKVLYPLIDENEYYSDPKPENANLWYKTKKYRPVTVSETGTVKYISYVNEDGSFNEDFTLEPNYLYNSDGTPKYYAPVGGGNADTHQLKIRVLYYNYYIYQNGFAPDYFFGTDSSGYDLMLRLAEGVRLSLLVAVCVSVINFLIGAIYGAVEGYYGGWVDIILERVSDILNNVPFIVVATLFQIHLAQKVGPLASLLFAFVLTGWIGTAYRVRTQFYRFKNQEYVMAARTLGARDRRIIWKHIFPNSLGTIITSSVLVIPGVIFSESMLSYLGIVKLGGASGTSLGTLLSDASAIWMNYPHLMIFPALIISLLMISFNLFGNGLRDAFNPSLRGVEE